MLTALAPLSLFSPDFPYNVFGDHLRLTITGFFHSYAGILHPFVGSDAIVFGTHENISNVSKFSKHEYMLSVAIRLNKSSISNQSEGLIPKQLDPALLRVAIRNTPASEDANDKYV